MALLLLPVGRDKHLPIPIPLFRQLQSSTHRAAASTSRHGVCVCLCALLRGQLLLDVTVTRLQQKHSVKTGVNGAMQKKKKKTLSEAG